MLLYNRPRVDLLLYFISRKLILKYIADLEVLREGLKKLNWWKQFRKEWDRCKDAFTQNVYDTKNSLFTCSCPAWLKSQYFICKHLVNQPCPQYRDLTINRQSPFIQINVNSKALFANIDGEKIVNELQQGTTCDYVNGANQNYHSTSLITTPFENHEDNENHTEGYISPADQ